MIEILTEYSPWYLILCLLVGGVYAFIMYTKNVPWSQGINYTLAGVRFVVATILCFLLLGPYVKLIENYFEKPVVVMAIDNSQSVAIVNDSTKIQESLYALDALKNQLQENDYEVEVRGIGEEASEFQNIKTVTFEKEQSNLSRSLQDLQRNYQNKNLAGIILFTDGIYNQGASPLYNAYKTKVSTIGIGDSLAKTDINLKNVYANRIAYLDNKFPVQAEITNTGFLGNRTQAQLIYNGEVIESKSIDFTEDEALQKVAFLVEAKEKGLQRYIIRINSLEGEFTLQNNRKSVYVDILDSKEKVLLIAASPHPDIKAFRSAIEKGKNYQFDVFIPGLTDRKETGKTLLDEKYDLIIFYQVPNRIGRATPVLRTLLESQTAKLFVIGAQSNLRQFNQLSEVAQIRSSGRNYDRVTPLFNNRFNRFTFDDDKRGTITKFPPATVPFGEYSLRTDFEIVLYQQVGSINTNKPLLAVGTLDGQKTGILFGEGIWQWRLQEYALNESQDSFDDIIGKLVQYLSSKEDKRKFRVYPTNNEYNNFETVYFETEVYNDIYEQVYGQRIDLRLTSDGGGTKEYVYVNSRAGFRYAINGLEEGIYKYTASTELNGNINTSSGEFSIRKLEIEAINTKADFNLLRQLAAQTGGEFVFPAQWQTLGNALVENKAPDVIHSRENTLEIIEMPWLLLIVIVLVSFEWFMRKYKGSY